MDSATLEIELEKFKNFIIQDVNEYAVEHTNVEPKIHILGSLPDDNKPTLAIVPIPGELMNSNLGKDLLTDKIIPEIMEHIRKDGITPVCLSMVTEGWMWKSNEPVKEGETLDKIDYEKLKRESPKIEIVMIAFEGENSTETHIFEKKGTKKNENGEFIAGVWLKPLEKVNKPMEGRFSNMFNKKVKG